MEIVARGYVKPDELPESWTWEQLEGEPPNRRDNNIIYVHGKEGDVEYAMTVNPRAARDVAAVFCAVDADVRANLNSLKEDRGA